MLLTVPNHIKIMAKQSLSQIDKLSVGTSVLEPSADMVDLRLPIASFIADSNQMDRLVVTAVMSSGKAIGVHEMGLWHEGKLLAIVYKNHDRVNHQPLFLMKPDFIYLVNLKIDDAGQVTLTVDERDDLSYAMTGILANTGKQTPAEKIAITTQFKSLLDKDSLFENQISSLTGHVETAQHTADNANEKADTATTKADNAQNTANNALNRANTANSAIIAEQEARENADNTNSQALRTLESTVNGIGGRVVTSESKIANLERTTSNTNQALATAQNQMNAKFDNLVVGGRNYFKNSTPLRVIGGGNFQKNNENGVTFTAKQATKTLFRLLNVIDSIGVWTVSCYAKATQNARLFIDINDDGQVQDTRNLYWNVFDISTEYQKIVATINTNKSSSVYDFVDFSTLSTETFTIKDLKIEKGTIPTDWTPAPEDYTAGLAIYNTTTAQSPNVFVSDTGQLQRSTSSERYKEIISPLVLDDKAYKNAMKLNPIIYRSTAEADKKDWHYYSFSAEQLGQFDKAFTLWRTPTETIIDDNGEITITELEPIAEGINLNAIVAFLHATNIKQGMLIRDLTKRIELLENKNNMEQ